MNKEYKSLVSKKNIFLFWKKTLKIFHYIENYSIVFLLSLLIIVSFLQIVLRLFTKWSFEWFSSLQKYTVLWIGMIAAGIATHEQKHIKIDIIGRYAKGRLKSAILAFLSLFACIVCIVLSVVSMQYILLIEKPSSDPAPFLDIPRWVLLLILPAGFALIGIRFLLRAGRKVYNFVINKEDEIDNLTSEFVFNVKEKKK